MHKTQKTNSNRPKGGSANLTVGNATATLNAYASRLVANARAKRAAQLRAAREHARAIRGAWFARARARALVIRARLARARKVRAHRESETALANHARARAARNRAPHFATNEAREVVREIAGGNATHAQRASAGKRWPINARLSRACALVQGRAIYWREGETARAAFARVVQPCASSEARAVQLRAASLAPHLSPRERAALDARTLAKVRAIAPAPAPDETPVAPVREWYFSAHLSPREQRIKRALNVSRRKGAARAEFARDIQTRAALARALCGVSREVARGALARFARARFARARALQREREATRGACAVAGQRARFHTHGALVVRERATGKRIGRKAARALAPASGAECFNARDSRAEILRGEFVLDARAGTGVPVEWQGVCEMRLAARAELLAGNGWKAANTSAARELNRVLKEPALSSVEKAARAADRRFALSRELWESAESDECAESDEQPQPHFAECLAESDEESEVSPLVLVFAKRKRAAQYLRAYWRAKKSPAARSLHARDLHTLREHSRAAIQGVRALVAFSVHRAISADEKAAKCAAQKAFRVGERVMEGKEMLAASAREVREVREVRAGIPRRAPVATLTIPRTRAEWFEIDAPALALRLLAKLHARTAHGSAAQSARRAGKAANARAEKAREVRAMRATLPAPALAALAEWQPSAGK